VSIRPTLVVLSNDEPDSRYGALHLAASFQHHFDTAIVDPTRGLGEACAWLASSRADALVLSGSDRSVLDPLPWIREEQEVVREAARRGVPVLGVCFGHQLIAGAFGATIVRKPKRVGIFTVDVVRADPILGSVGSTLRAPEQHGEHVACVPDGFDVLARSAECDIEAMRHRDAPLYGVQFHPCYEGDVVDEDEAWSGFDEARFVHDGAELLARAAAVFMRVCRSSGGFSAGAAPESVSQDLVDEPGGREG
jgi:GMP synthase (glutamine-hydrolysing)